MTRTKWLLGIILALGFGCASTRKIDWESRVGTYHFDSAVREMGVPDRQATLSDGTRVVEWLTSRGSYYGNTTYFPGSRFQQYDIDRFPDQFLRLTFDSEGKLIKVQKAYK